jgi:DNA mismatch repair protein MutS2
MIGDEQNIEENLSTFSSHLLHLNQILEKAGPRSLILLDELGVGTHASEGCALAMGFLDRFRESGASVVVTTHFDRLKVYGYLHPDVENVAVEFDEETLQPRYRLSYGASGLSNAFLIAEKLGISKRVLERAAYYRDGGEEGTTRALEILERLKVDTEKEREQLLEKKTEAGLERQRLKELLEGIKKRRQELLSLAEGKAREKVQKVEEELREWLRLQKEEAGRNVRPLSGGRKELQEIKEKFFPSVKEGKLDTPTGGVKIGEHVKIVSLRTRGVVTAIEEASSQVEVMTEKAKVKTFFSDIVGASADDEEAKISEFSVPARGIAPEPPAQLNVIGLTVEDALPIVDRFIDQALLHGLEKVQIIHGVGSGRLRDAIGKYLDGHRGVKKFASGEIAKGGRGVTIVELI